MNKKKRTHNNAIKMNIFSVCVIFALCFGCYPICYQCMLKHVKICKQVNVSLCRRRTMTKRVKAIKTRRDDMMFSNIVNKKRKKKHTSFFCVLLLALTTIKSALLTLVFGSFFLFTFYFLFSSFFLHIVDIHGRKPNKQ